MKAIYSFLLLAFALAGTAQAEPISYNITFSLTVGSIPATSGVFTYDAVTATFSNFFVEFNGLNVDLTQGANNGPYDAYDCGISSNAAGTFTALTGASTCHFLQWIAETYNVGTPPGEPSTVVAFNFGQTSLDPLEADFGGFKSGGMNLGFGAGTYTVSAEGSAPPVPEPPTVVMFAIGLTVVSLAMRTTGRQAARS